MTQRDSRPGLALCSSSGLNAQLKVGKVEAEAQKKLAADGR